MTPAEHPKASRATSFRLQLALQTTLVSGAIIALLVLGLWWFARQQLASTVDSRIAEPARRLWVKLTPRSSPPPPLDEMELRTATDDVFPAAVAQGFNSRVAVKLHDASGTVVFTTSALDPAIEQALAANMPPGELFGPAASIDRPPGPPVGRPGWRRPRAESEDTGTRAGSAPRRLMPEVREPVYFTAKSTQGERWRFGAYSNPSYTVFVGLLLDDFDVEAARISGWYALAGLGGLSLAGLLSWWIAGRAIRPLARIVETVEALDATELDRRIPRSQKDAREFASLINVLNGMMERLEASYKQAIRFSADASHELQTPLAIMHSTLHDALRHATPESAEFDSVEAAARQVGRLKAITQSLLLLSQADAGKLLIRPEKICLSEELMLLVEDAEVLSGSAGLRLEHSIAPGLEVEADRSLLRQVFQNLLSNAVKYNRPGGQVDLRLYQQKERAVLTISNTGPVISEEEQTRVFERFYRSEAVAHCREGAGLGLNIAVELAKANGAELTLLGSTPERTTFQLVMDVQGTIPRFFRRGSRL